MLAPTRTAPRLASLLIATLAAWSSATLVATDAAALDLVASPSARFSMATYSDDDDTNDDFEPGFAPGFGVQLPVLITLMPGLSVGPVLDMAFHYHATDDDLGTTRYAFSAFTLGAKTRYVAAQALALELWLGYVTGSTSLTFEVEGTGEATESEAELGGFGSGLAALYRYQLAPYETWIEAGPFVALNLLSYEPQREGAQEASVTYLNFGLTLQGTFEFGL